MTRSGYQMVDHIAQVDRSANTTLQHVGKEVDDETVILECIDAAISIMGPGASDTDFYRAIHQVRAVFEQGYREELLKLPDSFKLYILEKYVSPEQIDLVFGLLRLKPDVLPISFRFLKLDNFEKFEQEVSVTFSEHFADLGSIDFLEKLYTYFATHGYGREWDTDSETYINLPGRHDRYMTYTALVLKDVYGENKMMDFIDRLIKEIPVLDATNFNVENFNEKSSDPLAVRAVDALRIIQSDADFSETPLLWAAQIASER